MIKATPGETVCSEREYLELKAQVEAAAAIFKRLFDAKHPIFSMRGAVICYEIDVPTMDAALDWLAQHERRQA